MCACARACVCVDDECYSGCLLKQASNVESAVFRINVAQVCSLEQSHVVIDLQVALLEQSPKTSVLHHAPPNRNNATLDVRKMVFTFAFSPNMNPNMNEWKIYNIALN